MDKYEQNKRFIHDCWIQSYMYASMYVNTETMSEEEYFLATIFLRIQENINSSTSPKTLAWI